MFCVWKNYLFAYIKLTEVLNISKFKPKIKLKKSIFQADMQEVKKGEKKS